jgi:hypothetical protein
VQGYEGYSSPGELSASVRVRSLEHFKLVGADDVGVQNLDVRHRLDNGGRGVDRIRQCFV